MNIGVFDSGLGGLFILRALVRLLPQYNYIYAGDTKHVPYGSRSPKAIFEYTKESVEFLFKKNCAVIILACNTASALALRKIQKEFLPAVYPTRRVLGVLIPTAEVVRDADLQRVGVLATQSTVDSKAFTRELKKLNPGIRVYEKSAPLLVPMIESGDMQWSSSFLESYLRPFRADTIDGLVLGCTHYALIKRDAKKIAGPQCHVVSPDEFISKKFAEYLTRHPELEKKMGTKRTRQFFVTDITPTLRKRSREWFGGDITLQLVNFNDADKM